jgi:tetratricopeptide (TPR) repeat protein
MRKVAVPLVVLMVAAVLLSGCDTLSARMELNKANGYYKDEKYKDALYHFQNGLKMDPGLKFAWRSVALTAMTLYRPGVDTPENNQFANVTIDAFKKYIEAFPQDQKAKDFLLGFYEKANRTDEVLKYLLSEIKQNPSDYKSHKAIVSLYLRTQRIKEANDWVLKNIPKVDAEPHYLVAVYCWDKAYRDATLSPDQRNEYVELGLSAIDRAVKLQPEYFEAMVYYNLLYREKAKLQKDDKAKQEYFDKAEEWRTKAMALREKLKKQPALAKS